AGNWRGMGTPRRNPGNPRTTLLRLPGKAGIDGPSRSCPWRRPGSPYRRRINEANRLVSSALSCQPYLDSTGRLRDRHVVVRLDPPLAVPLDEDLLKPRPKHAVGGLRNARRHRPNAAHFGVDVDNCHIRRDEFYAADGLPSFAALEKCSERLRVALFELVVTLENHPVDVGEGAARGKMHGVGLGVAFVPRGDLFVHDFANRSVIGRACR